LAIHTAQDLGTPGPDYLENDSEEAPPDFLVEWGATPGKRYQVDTSIDLKTWTAIPGETVATAGTASYIHSAADSPAAYVRVSQLPD
ncbi:MAG: hypothetical protein P8J87_11570, partial [Verrucomicrobiales bacterium]|nr:hypothetical protein [Verrucomicrobiales bacterium]